MERGGFHRQPAAAATLLLLALAAGCSDAADDVTKTSASTTTTAVTLTCPAPIEVDEAADLIAALAGLQWHLSGQQTSGLPALTPDLVVAGTVTLAAADIPVPEDCLAESDCFHVAAFVGQAPGATLEGSAGPEWMATAARLTLADTTVRLGPQMLDTHPREYNLVPVVSVEPPCGTPCTEGLAMCPADGSCYAVGDFYCRRCEGRPAEECACRAPDGSVLTDGTSCEYWISGDWGVVGDCRQGVCEEE